MFVLGVHYSNYGSKNDVFTKQIMCALQAGFRQ